MRQLGLLAALLLVVSAAWASPDITLSDLNGKSHRLSDYRGKWVIVNYWATWCPPCREEIPDLVMFYEKNKSKAVVLGINMEQIDVKALRQFVDDNLISYPVFTGTVDAEVGPVPGLPTTYLVDPEGRLVARQVGMITSEVIEAFINKK